jgi:hypothetical protein
LTEDADDALPAASRPGALLQDVATRAPSATAICKTEAAVPWP